MLVNKAMPSTHGYLLLEVGIQPGSIQHCENGKLLSEVEDCYSMLNDRNKHCERVSQPQTAICTGAYNTILAMLDTAGLYAYFKEGVIMSTWHAPVDQHQVVHKLHLPYILYADMGKRVPQQRPK